MRRITLILLVAGILGVLIFLATRTNDSGASLPGPEPQADVVETRHDSELASPSTPATDRSEVASAADDAPAAIDDASWRVCVVDGLTNAVVAGATVSIIDSSAIMRELEPRGIGFDSIEGLRLRRERAIEAKTGADGCARFAAPVAHAMVEARSGANWAIAVVSEIPKDRCVTLKLTPDRELRVRVVDAAGTAVGGVPVALRLMKPRMSWKWTDTQSGTGLATFLHFQRRLEQGPGWNAVFAFPLRNEPKVPVDADTPLEPPLTLVLPDTGRVRVRVRTADGRFPDLEGIELRLDAFERESNASQLWVNGPWSRPHLDASGEAFAPWIGLGLNMKASLVKDGEDIVTASFAGPAQAGEEVLCELVCASAAPAMLSGRFVLRDGRAWPATTVFVSATIFPIPSPWPKSRAFDLDSNGRFRMPVHDARPTNGTRAFQFAAMHPDGLGQVLATVPLDQELPAEGLDIGDIVLDFGELLAAGRVVDESFRPIAGASFNVNAHGTALGKAVEPRIRTAGTNYTPENGEFALYLPLGEPQPGEELRVTAQAPGFVESPARDIRRGQRDVELVLRQAGGLAGSLELERGLAVDEFTLFLTGETKRYVSLRSDATFEMEQLPPGTYSLDVLLRGAKGQPESVALVSGLVVRAGETCRDLRIQKLQIQSSFATLKIRVVDRTGKAVRGVAISIVGAADSQVTHSQDDGVCSVRCAALPVDLDVSAFGYQRQRLSRVSADQDVVLDAGLPIRLHVDAAPSGTDPKYMLGTYLFTVDEKGVTGKQAWGADYQAGYAFDRTYFGERGELALRMPAAGVYECHVFVTVVVNGVFRGANVELASKPRITVLANPAEQLFELSVLEAAVKAAVYGVR